MGALVPLGRSPVFPTAGDACQCHDAILMAKDDLRGKHDLFLCTADPETTYQSRLAEWKQACLERDPPLRLDQVYLPLPDGGFLIRAGCPFHRSADDNKSDLKAPVAVGNQGVYFDVPAPFPKDLKLLMGANPPGMGHRVYEVAAATWNVVAHELSLP
eukprot:3461202-Pyramimonas_sp.AAC.1